jgi:hypothetical protein
MSASTKESAIFWFPSHRGPSRVRSNCRSCSRNLLPTSESATRTVGWGCGRVPARRQVTKTIVSSGTQCGSLLYQSIVFTGPAARPPALPGSGATERLRAERIGVTDGGAAERLRAERIRVTDSGATERLRAERIGVTDSGATERRLTDRIGVTDMVCWRVQNSHEYL